MSISLITTITRPIKASSLIAALLMATPIIAVPTLVAAQDSSAEVMHEVQDMLAWMNQATEITVALTDLFQTELMTQIYASIDTGDFETIRAAGREYNAMRNQVLPDVRARIDALPAPERWNIDPTLFDPQERALFRAAQTQYETMEDLYTKISEITKSLSTMLMELEDIEEATLETLVKSQQDMGVALIRIENQQVRGYLAAIPKDNPNHQFQRLVLQTNLAVIEEISMPLDIDLDDRKKAGRDMIKALKSADDIIATGRQNYLTSTAEVREYSENTNVSQEERDFLVKALGAMANFPDQFDVEAAMIAAIRKTAELYTSDRETYAIEPEVAALELQRFSLIDQRVNLVTTRLSRMQ